MAQMPCIHHEPFVYCCGSLLRIPSPSYMEVSGTPRNACQRARAYDRRIVYSAYSIIHYALSDKIGRRRLRFRAFLPFRKITSFMPKRLQMRPLFLYSFMEYAAALQKQVSCIFGPPYAVTPMLYLYGIWF